MAGPFWGERVTLRGPRDLKNRPSYSMRRTLAGSANTAASRSHHHRILIPRAPEPPADLHELVRAVVAGVGRLALLAVVGGLIAVDRRHHVPAGPAAGEVVEGRPEPGGVERMAVAHRERGRDPDPLRDRRHVGQQRDWVVLRRLGRVAKGRPDGPRVGVGDVVEIREEHGVEEPALASTGDMLVDLGAVPGEAPARRSRRRSSDAATSRGCGTSARGPGTGQGASSAVSRQRPPSSIPFGPLPSALVSVARAPGRRLPNPDRRLQLALPATCSPGTVACDAGIHAVSIRTRPGVDDGFREDVSHARLGRARDGGRAPPRARRGGPPRRARSSRRPHGRTAGHGGPLRRAR